MDQPSPDSKDTGPEHLVCSRDSARPRAPWGPWDGGWPLGRLYKLSTVAVLSSNLPARPSVHFQANGLLECQTKLHFLRGRFFHFWLQRKTWLFHPEFFLPMVITIIQRQPCASGYRSPTECVKQSPGRPQRQALGTSARSPFQNNRSSKILPAPARKALPR